MLIILVIRYYKVRDFEFVVARFEDNYRKLRDQGRATEQVIMFDISFYVKRHGTTGNSILITHHL